MPNIKFISNRHYLNGSDDSNPIASVKSLPDWYIDADRYLKMPNNEYFLNQDGSKIPSWKACPAIYDIMGTGYVQVTPCDIEFYINSSGIISVKVLDRKYENFIHTRTPMPQFKVPFGYHSYHFAWWSEWGIELPKGYSALYSQPFNRFDLPFLTTSGIIDNDKVDMPGTMPFFISKDWVGIIPKGTPFVQIFPFKREDWKSEIRVESPQNIEKRNFAISKKYRKPNGGVYQKEVWERRKYE
jgi:hypothetical protein